MTRGKLVPELRFPEFSGEWEERKGKEIFKTISIKNKEYLEVLSSTQDRGVIYRKDLEMNLQYNRSNLKNYKKVSKSDYIISLRSFQGGIECSNLEGIMSPAYTVFNFAKKENFKTQFFSILFKSKDFIRLLDTLTHGVRDGKSISYGDFASIKFKYPTIKEQEKIGSFFYKIDKKLELQKERIEELENHKKAMMQRIFDQEIRFKSENGENYPDWEEKKLGEIGEIITGETPKSKNINHFGDKYLWATPGDIKSNRYIMKTGRMLSEKGFNVIRKINKNSVMATCIGSTIGKLAMASEIMATNQQINSLECNDENNPEFIYYNLIYNNNLFHKYASTQAVPLINKSTFSNIGINVGDLEEQEKIANFLSSIDNKIELEKEKLEKYEELKRGLMQRMFI